MPWGTVTIAVLTMIAPRCLCAGQDVTDLDLDRKLTAFCKEAILLDRGFSSRPTGITTEEVICSHLAKQGNFQNELGLTAAQISQLTSCPRTLIDAENPGRSNRGDKSFFQFYRPNDPFRTHLTTTLTARQLEKLPAIYLHAEGLMALMRPDVQKLVGLSMEKQGRVEKLIEKEWKENAALCHYARFVMRSEEQFRDEIALHHADLRTGAAKLDCEILSLLNRDERCRLLKIVRDARPLKRIVKLPGLSEIRSSE